MRATASLSFPLINFDQPAAGRPAIMASKRGGLEMTVSIQTLRQRIHTHINNVATQPARLSANQ